MQRILRWIIGLPIAVTGIAFAVANRRWVTLSFDPFSSEAPFASIDMPLWALLFFGAFIGMIIGWITAWLGQGKWRKLARESRHEVARLQEELTVLRRDKPTSDGEARDLVTFGDGAP